MGRTPAGREVGLLRPNGSLHNLQPNHALIWITTMMAAARLSRGKTGYEIVTARPRTQWQGRSGPSSCRPAGRLAPNHDGVARGLWGTTGALLDEPAGLVWRPTDGPGFHRVVGGLAAWIYCQTGGVRGTARDQGLPSCTEQLAWEVGTHTHTHTHTTDTSTKVARAEFTVGRMTCPLGTWYTDCLTT